MYTDYITRYVRGRDMPEIPAKLNADMAAVSSLFAESKVTLNAKQTIPTLIEPKTRVTIEQSNFDFSVDVSILETVHEFKYLGVALTIYHLETSCSCNI